MYLSKNFDKYDESFLKVERLQESSSLCSKNPWSQVA
jgi:hypothetical protein